MSTAPDLPGVPGIIARAANNFRRFTTLFPPAGFGVGVGLALGCGIGWPIRHAYGPPIALCGPGVGFGVGFGYGQGFGRRFGKDRRPEQYTDFFSRLENTLDGFVIAFLATLKRLIPRKRQLPASED